MTMTSQLTHEQIAAAMTAEQQALNAVIAKVSDADWATLNRTDGWTIHDMAAHIADNVFMLSYVLTNGMPSGAAPFDLDANNAKNREASLGKPRAEIEGRLAAAFTAAHQALPGTDLGKPGPFPNMSVGDVLMIIPGHTQGHREEIERILAAKG